MVDCPSQYTSPTPRLVALRRPADGIQPDRAHLRARTDPHGQSTGRRCHRTVAASRWRAERQVPWQQPVGTTPHGQRNGQGFRPDQQRADKIVLALQKVSADLDRSVAQVALAGFAIAPSRLFPSSALASFPSCRKNLASLEVTLSPDQVRALDEASQIELGFPYSWYAKEMPRAIAYGGLRDQILA